MGDDPALQTALDTAVSEALTQFPGLAHPFRAAISFVAVDQTPNGLDFRHAGLRYGDSYFTASLAKIGALYAAYELLRSVNAVAREVTKPQELFTRLRNEFDPVIDASVPAIAETPALTRAQRLPKYEQIFATAPAGGALACSFQPGFQDSLNKMIIKGANDTAAAVIQALGYSWINGVLKAGGFFFPPAATGIWLAGTFTGSLPVVRIPSVNDGMVAQASTCFDMANLYAHIVRRTLVDPGSSNFMHALLATSASVGDDPSYLDFTRRSALPPRDFGVLDSKIGRGPLKTGIQVLSEAAVVETSDSAQQFVVVFQDSLKDLDSLSALGYIVDRTIKLSRLPPAGPPPGGGPSDVVQALGTMGVDFSVPEADLRNWLANPDFTPYPAIAQSLLGWGHQLKAPVFLDVIVWNYEHAPGVTSPRAVTDVQPDVLKAAVLEASNKRHGTQATTVEQLFAP
ncbi:hypothetical protein [Streptomyces triticiradicis]|uniref:hypothetical protein n=1 Tax=Streptomyces triticiradicis TaxID=2651189 RepID=UPI001788D29E|nr:hypothetical protein [Streptomyces triticiradicis]